MIADRIMEYLESPGFELADHDLDVAAADCRRTMKRNLGVRREDGSRKLRGPRPSSTWACGRQMVYNSLGLQTEGYGWRSRLTFTHGDMTEAMGILLCRQVFAGEDILISPDIDGKQLNLEVTIDPSMWDVDGEPFELEGNLDMTIRGLARTEEPVDWKSSSRYTFAEARDAAADPTHRWWQKERNGYIAQVRMYMIMLRATQRSPADRGYLVFVCKDTGHLCEVVIDKDHQAERDLIRRAVYANEKIQHAREKRAVILEDREDEETGDLDHFGKPVIKVAGDGYTDELLNRWTHEHVPRSPFTDGIVAKKNAATKRPDGTKGPCLELDMKSDPEAFRCSYCDHTARCWPGFNVVPMSKPVWRTNGVPTE